MSRNYLILLIIVGFVGLLLGCHAGGNAPFVNVPSDEQVTTLNAIVDKNGVFQNIVFPSGATIRCSENFTLQEGTEITAEERKTAINGVSTFLYTLKAVYNSDNVTNTIEHPLIVTLPNNNDSGTCYIGLRDNESSSWRYSLATDGNTNIRFARLQATTPKQCTFNLFKVGVQFALFAFKENKDDTKVDSVVAVTPETPVATKDGKYAGNLAVKLNIDGENLTNIDTANLVARITYRSKNSKGATISFASNQADALDKTHSSSYEHSFEVSNIKVENTLGNNAELSFELNLEGVRQDEFPTSFLIEVYSKVDVTGSNTRPFTYTQVFSFETQEKQDEPEPEPEPLVTYTITYDLDGGQLTTDNPSEYTVETEITLNNPTKTGIPSKAGVALT